MFANRLIQFRFRAFNIVLAFPCSSAYDLGMVTNIAVPKAAVITADAAILRIRCIFTQISCPNLDRTILIENRALKLPVQALLCHPGPFLAAHANMNRTLNIIPQALCSRSRALYSGCEDERFYALQ